MAAEPDSSGISALFDPNTELGRDLAAVDWAASALGPLEQWPTSLRNVVSLVLGSRFAMWMAWGPELTFFCNDAYRRDTLGAKYPWALGRRADEVWSEIWPDIGPRIASVISTGEATWDEGLLLFLERSGYQEETYHTFSYSPITDDDGRIAGMLCVVSEDTARVVGERRMATVRDLGTDLARASTPSEVSAAVRRQLGHDPNNLPFVAAYLFDDDGVTAHLAWTAGIDKGHPATPTVIRRGERKAAWPLRDLLAGRSLVVDNLTERFPALPTGAWDEPPVRALVVPFTQPGERKPLGFMVVGLNRYRPLDAAYRGFVDLIATQVAAAITRTRAFEDERQRAEDLAELDRAKTTFFTNVSHELRTPLTLLLGPAEDALADGVEPLAPAQRTRVEVIQRNAERLLKLVNTLLDFSRMEAGRSGGRFEPLDLARYTAELAAMFESALHRAGLELTVECTPLDQPVYVDAEMWAKIVLNLLSNALKATFTGGITVRLADVGGVAQLDVIDTGAGIPIAEQQRLFERFHRVSGADLRSHEGSGIGLALVAELAGTHGGKVGVMSEPGGGSTFTVRIPYGFAHLPADQVVLETLGELPLAAAYSAGYLAEATRWLADSGDTAGAPAVEAGRPTVLVVDDNADMREYVSGLLADDYQVRTAQDGVEALAFARSNPPDLVLTDVMMPRLDGFGLLTALRADPSTMHVPIVMLSARSGDDATVEGLEAGADDYLVKPFSARELIARVRANLELDRVRRLADELARSRSLLDQAEELAHVGSWEIDLRNNAVVGSAEYFRILGVPTDHLDDGGLERAMQLVRADDREVLAVALERTAQTGAPLDIELHLTHPGGEERLARAHGLLHYTSDGEPAFIRGSVQDITEQRLAEQAVTAAVAAREAAAREHAIAEELQRSLLPDALFDVAPLDVATYYRAGVEGTQAGGDWYDVIELPRGRTALVLGDVMGRGVRAAAVMGQLRATVRAYSRIDLPPDQLLNLLDEAVRGLSEHMIVTCIYAIYDPDTATLTYGNAGHLPPLLTSPGRGHRRLTVGGPPLGTGHPITEVETVSLPEGATLTLYTDGLVEQRGSDLDAGINRLATLLEHSAIPVEALPSYLADALLPAAPDDDVAVLIARVTSPTDRRWRAAVASTTPVPASTVSEIRRAASNVLTEWDVSDDIRWDVLLAVSELVTNAIRHAKPPVEIRLRRLDTSVILEVHDGSSALPAARAADPEEASGRGLHLVETLASAWGTRPTGNGKSIWCVLALEPNREAARA
jgi:PAS domain S-box-containing protein